MKNEFPEILILPSACKLSPANKKRKNYDLCDFPAEWIMLTPTDSGSIIFNSCDMGNALLSGRTVAGSTSTELTL
jgi:hypothetical protein